MAKAREGFGAGPVTENDIERAKSASQRTNLNMGKLPGKSADKRLDLKGYDDTEKMNAAVFLRKGFSDEDAKEMAKQKAFGSGAKGMKSGGKVSSASKRADGCAIRGKTRA